MKVYVLTAGNGREDGRYDVLGAYPDEKTGREAMKIAEGWIPKANLRLTEAYDLIPSANPDAPDGEDRERGSLHRLRRKGDSPFFGPTGSYDVAICGMLRTYSPFSGAGAWYDGEGKNRTAANMIDFYESGQMGDYVVERQLYSFPKEKIE